jgi:hypothetical protein
MFSIFWIFIQNVQKPNGTFKSASKKGLEGYGIYASPDYSINLGYSYRIGKKMKAPIWNGGLGK